MWYHLNVNIFKKIECRVVKTEQSLNISNSVYNMLNGMVFHILFQSQQYCNPNTVKL